ncbi:MAG: VOC family protein [Chloroflexota bacterium]
MNTLLQNNTGTYTIHPLTRIGRVALVVNDLQGQIDFYRQVLNLKVHWQTESEAGLGAGGEDFLHLTQNPTARRYPRTSGLYHFAVLFPNQRELARAIARLFTLRYPNYPTDHIMTKTTYLSDPEGNGIELYAESPEDGYWTLAEGHYITRRKDGSLSSGREPLDVEKLFSLLSPQDKLENPLPAETRIGHIHLHVSSLDPAVDFYHRFLGFDLMGQDQSIRMAFVSAGGYHHHIGLNTWQGEGAPPPPADAAGLQYFAIQLPEREEVERLKRHLISHTLPIQEVDNGFMVRDPSQNRILLTAAR